MLRETTILRSLRAWAVEKPWAETVLDRVKDYVVWRNELQLDRLVAAPDERMVQRHQLWRELWCMDIYTCDSMGHLVTVQRMGRIDFKRALAEFSTAEMLCHLALDLELTSLATEALAKRSGILRYKIVSILDMDGVGTGHMESRMIKCIKMIVNLPAQRAPETLWRMYIVNTTRGFNFIWKIIKPILPKEILSRIDVLPKKTPEVTIAKLRAAGIDPAMVPIGAAGESMAKGKGLLRALSARAVIAGYYWKAAADKYATRPPAHGAQNYLSVKQPWEQTDGTATGSTAAAEGRNSEPSHAGIRSRLLPRTHLELLHDRAWTYACLGLGARGNVFVRAVSGRDPAQ